MFCAYTRPRYQVCVYRTIGPLVFIFHRTVNLSLRLKNNDRRAAEMRKLHDGRVRQDKTSSQSSLTIHLKKVLVRYETIIFIFDWLDAQSDFSFRLSQMPFCLCGHVVYDFVSVTE